MDNLLDWGNFHGILWRIICRFIHLRFVKTIVGVFGLLGNTFNIFILTSTEVRNTFNLMLACLSIFDNIFIIISILDYGLFKNFIWPFDEGSDLYSVMLAKILFPLNNIFLTASIFLTISIAYERYIFCKMIILQINKFLDTQQYVIPTASDCLTSITRRRTKLVWESSPSSSSPLSSSALSTTYPSSWKLIW